MTLRRMACARHRMLTLRIVATAAATVFLFALVGCGVSSLAPGAANEQGTAPPSSTTATTTARASSTATSSNSAGSQACPGGIDNDVSAGVPQLVLGVGGVRAGQVRHGELIQVRLSATNRWSFHGTGTLAGLLQPAGIEDQQHHICIWNFRPQTVTSLTLTFIGTSLCVGKGACPQFRLNETFSVQVQ